MNKNKERTNRSVVFYTIPRSFSNIIFSLTHLESQQQFAIFASMGDMNIPCSSEHLPHQVTCNKLNLYRRCMVAKSGDAMQCKITFLVVVNRLRDCDL